LELVLGFVGVVTGVPETSKSNIVNFDGILFPIGSDPRTVQYQVPAGIDCHVAASIVRRLKVRFEKGITGENDAPSTLARISSYSATPE
jgi:hypothetical protein